MTGARHERHAHCRPGHRRAGQADHLSRALRERRAGTDQVPLGEHFGLSHYGVNLHQLAPGAASALLHSHSLEDELVYIVSGTPVLIIDAEEFTLKPGDCCGFKAGTGKAHQLVNRSDSLVTYLEMGNRAPGEQVNYPNDDLHILNGAGRWTLLGAQGWTPY